MKNGVWLRVVVVNSICLGHIAVFLFVKSNVFLNWYGLIAVISEILTKMAQ